MTAKTLKSILDATFRANPNYELVVFDRLSPERERLNDQVVARSHHDGIARVRRVHSFLD